MQVVQVLDNIVDLLLVDKIVVVNQQVLECIIQLYLVLIGFDQVINVVLGMMLKIIFYVGLLIIWEKMCGVMKGVVIGVLVFEGLVKDFDEVIELVVFGEIIFLLCYEYDCVGLMVGVILVLMFMYIVKNKIYGNIVYINMSEQMVKILCMGVNDQSVIDCLNWMCDVQGLILCDVMKIIGEIDLCLMLVQVLYMGDECYNCNNVGMILLIQVLMLGIIQVGYFVE